MNLTSYSITISPPIIELSSTSTSSTPSSSLLMAGSNVFITPPESFTDSDPLTPPLTDNRTKADSKLRTALPTIAVLRIVSEVKRRKAGYRRCEKAWVGFKLLEEEYREALRLIRSDNDHSNDDDSLHRFWKQKLRFDYFPSTTRFIFRMPTEVHETIIINLVEGIQQQLRSITNPSHPLQQPSSLSFAQEIKHIGSATIKFTDPEYGKHDPDAQFRHSLAQYPGVVLEVSYSQKRLDLPRLADDYILGSDGNIKVMIGLDIEYRGSKKATLSTWQPQILSNDVGEMELVAVQTVTDQIFRDDDGQPNASKDAGLHLQLQDFAPKSVIKLYKEPMNETIFIPAKILCSYLESAEKTSEMVDRKKGMIGEMDKNYVRKRRRVSTPPENLDQRYRKRFRDDEKRAFERTEKDDESWKGGSSNDDSFGDE